jgi:hypothetical protein
MDASHPTAFRMTTVGRILRPHTWLGNLLVLVPLLLAHRVPAASDPLAQQQWLAALTAYTAFCLATSAVHVLDWLTRQAETAPTGQRRPASVPVAAFSVILLLLGVGALCLLLPPKFAAVLTVYVVISLAHCFRLKRSLLPDVFLLTGLCTLRLLAGGYGASVEVSPWLLGVAVFLFLSLASARRYTSMRLEITQLLQRGTADVMPGRPQNRPPISKTNEASHNVRSDLGNDLKMLETTGPVSGYMAVLVIALYIRDPSSAATRLYPSPSVLWLLCPLLMYWLTRLWFFASRGQLSNDILLFAVKDRVTWYTILLASTLVLLARQPWLAGL